MMIRLFNEEDQFIQETTDQIIAALPGKRGTFALSGGSTPQKIYKALPDLPNVEFFQVDERYVPLTDNDSNHKLIRDTINPEKFHYFDTSLPIEDALEQYESELPKEPFDIIILGIGPDGHTASLFPQSPALEETGPVSYTTTDEFTVHDRLTLTFSVIMKAKKLIVLLKGSEKQQLLDKLTSAPLKIDDFPAKKLLQHPNLNIHLFVPTSEYKEGKPVEK